MIKGILFFLLMCAPPANAHLNLDLSREFDDRYTSELDPFATRGLKMSYLSSVVVQVLSGDVPMGTGSGNYFRLGRHRFIITAAHVVEGQAEILIIEKGSIMTKAAAVYVDKDADIAILIPEEKLKYTKAVPFRRDINNQMGEKIYHCGHPAQEGWHISEGILTGTHNDVLMLNTFAWPGSSGSVVFDVSGRVVGVISALRVDAPFGLPAMIEHLVLASNIKMLDHQTLKALLRDGSR